MNVNITSNWCNVSNGLEEFFGNMVGDAFLSAIYMVVTREFGLIGELFHMVFQNAIS